MQHRRFSALMIAILAVAGWTAACDSSAAPPADPTPYLGTWAVTNGDGTLNCGFTLPIMQAFAGTIVLARSTTAPLQATFSDRTLADCMLFLDVVNGVARVRPPVTCALSHFLFSGTITVDSGSMTVMGDTATVGLTGQV